VKMRLPESEGAEGQPPVLGDSLYWILGRYWPVLDAQKMNSSVPLDRVGLRLADRPPRMALMMRSAEYGQDAVAAVAEKMDF
jgi:hypothetical protein